VLQNILPTILTFGCSREKFLISLDWNTAVAVEVAASELPVSEGAKPNRGSCIGPATGSWSQQSKDDGDPLTTRPD
jgi:hypothetical protein